MTQTAAADSLLPSLAPCAVIQVGRDGRVVSWNAVAAQILAIPPEQAVGRPVLELAHPANRASVAAAFGAVLGGQPASSIVAPVYDAEGSRGVAVWTILPTHDPDGTVSGVIATGLRLPQLPASEPGPAAEQFWRDVFDANPQAVAILDAEDRVLGINARFTALFGYTQDEALGRTIQSLLHGDRRPTEAVRALPVGERLTFNLERQTKTGTRVALRVEAVAFEVAPQRRGIVVGYRRQDHQREVEEQFIRAQRMEGVALVAAGVLHDVNNLLTVALGEAEFLGGLLRELPAGVAVASECREAATLLHDAVRQASALSRMVGPLARPRNAHPLQIHLPSLVERLRPALAALVGRHTTLHLDLDPTAPPVHAIPEELEQVLINLAVNARDAMPNGGALHIRTRTVDLAAPNLDHSAAPPGRYVALDITDTGLGMSPEVARRVFEPFFTTKQAEGGTGLGLATVQRIVRRLGGGVTLETHEGGGTTFRVLLPVKDAS